MGFFYISAPFLENSREATHREIKDVVLKKSIADGQELFVDRKKFKLANLDTLMMVNDKLLKLENGIEGFLKKIDRQYLDLQEKVSNEWFVKSGDKEINIVKFLNTFNWNEAKYPRSYPLPRITEIIEAKLNTFENELRNRTNAYNETKTQLTQNTQKEYLICLTQGQLLCARSDRYPRRTICLPSGFRIHKIPDNPRCDSPNPEH